MQQLGFDQQFFFARTGTVDVDRGIDALFGGAAIKVHFHVAGTFEFLVNHVVHTAAGIDQCCGDNGERATFLDVARGTEEAFGPLQRIGVDTAGQDLAGSRYDGVIGARQTGDGIEQDHHIFLVLDQALGFFDHHFCDLHVARGGFVEGGGNHFTFHGTGHFGHFFGPLIDQQHDEHHLRMIGGNGVRNVLQHDGLAGLR